MRTSNVTYRETMKENKNNIITNNGESFSYRAYYLQFYFYSRIS